MEGIRLVVPERVPGINCKLLLQTEPLRSLITRCWESIPETRPTFDLLFNIVDEMLQKEEFQKSLLSPPSPQKPNDNEYTLKNESPKSERRTSTENKEASTGDAKVEPQNDRE